MAARIYNKSNWRDHIAKKINRIYSLQKEDYSSV